LQNITKKFKEFIMKKLFSNLIYLLLGLPLGVLYFVILITGFSLGAGLIITLVGAPILVAMIFVTYILGDLDRTITSKLLGIKISKPEARPSNSDTATSILVAQLKSLQFWKEFFYLLLKMPLGVISFTFAITVLSVSLALILTPFIYTYVPDAQIMLWNGFEVDTMSKAVMTSVVGIIATAIAIPLVNGIAQFFGSISVWVLGKAE
jgi:hypothetical protein